MTVLADKLIAACSPAFPAGVFPSISCRNDFIKQAPVWGLYGLNFDTPPAFKHGESMTDKKQTAKKRE